MNLCFVMELIGMIISLIGVWLVITEGQILSGHVAFASSDLIILAGSIGWAAYTVGTRAFVVGAMPLETTSWTRLFGTIALVLVAFIYEDPIEAARAGTGVSYAAILWMGISVDRRTPDCHDHLSGIVDGLGGDRHRSGRHRFHYIAAQPVTIMTWVNVGAGPMGLALAIESVDLGWALRSLSSAPQMRDPKQRRL